VGAVSDFFSGVAGSGGFAAKMTADLDSYLDKKEGLFASVSKTLDSQLKELSERYDAKQVSIDAAMARYSKQFSALDVLISKMNSTADYLTQQFDALTKDK
jgi:flagellar hook-associated protein 2